MSDAAIVIAIILVAVGLFIWNRLPPPIVGLAVALALFFSGVLTMPQALGGFGDPVVLMLVGLFVIATGLEAAGVTTWAGQKLIDAAAGAYNRAFVLLMLVAGVGCAVMGFNATVAALMPVAIVLAIRLDKPTSQLMMPLAFVSHSGSILTLVGTPINVIALGAAQDVGGYIGFFEFGVAGVPLFLGTLVMIFLSSRFLLPHRNGPSIPANFSEHGFTLVEQYRLRDGLHRLRVRAGSPLIGRPRSSLDLADYDDLALVTVQSAAGGGPSARATFAADDEILVRGAAQAAGRLATDFDLGVQEDPEICVAGTLFNQASGLAEVVIPPRSAYVGERVFPGMATPSGDLMIVAIHRGGEDLGGRPVELRAGDTLLLQGTWGALDRQLATPQVLVVDAPDLVRRQAVPLSHKAAQAIAVLGVMIVLLAGDFVPAAVATLSCAAAMVLLGVITVPQAYKGIDWNTCVLIGAMIPIAPAMAQSGVDAMIGGGVVELVGEFGPLAVLLAIFAVTVVLTQLMANTAAALVMLPIAVAAAEQIGVSPLPLILAVAIGAQAALLTPVGTPPNLVVMGPGGYAFGDYWKLGLPILLWWFVVVGLVVPLWWNF